MANPEHLALLKQGVRTWNEWREANRGIEPSFCKANLSRSRLNGANLHGADLSYVDLREANLRGANLRGANLREADLFYVDLSEADLREANLCEANLRGADLRGVNLCGADLRGVDLNGAQLYRTNLSEASLRRADFGNTGLRETVFANVNLIEAKNLDTCHHSGPSILDVHTLQQSSPLPPAFLRGCGLPDLLINYLPFLFNQPIQYYSCFISYSSKDEDFAQRLHADLQNKGVRCWFAPKDIQGGRKIYEQLGEAIQLHEKSLLVLSKNSMNSKWVKTEIAEARQREVREKCQVLFPIRLVDYETIKQWNYFDADIGESSAREIREYYTPDFSNWKSHDAYQQAFNRLLRDLKSELERKPES